MRPQGSTFLLVLLFLAHGYVANAQTAPQTFTLDGRLFSDTAGTTPLVESAISFEAQILDPTQTCVLYDEVDTLDTLSSNGYFTVQIGSPTSGSGSSKRGTSDSGNSMATVYSNTVTSVTGKLLSNGSACPYAPASGDQRYVRIVVTPSDAGQQVFSPNLVLDSAPSAITAERADTIQGLAPSALLQVNTTAPAVLSQSNLENVFSATNYPILTSLLAGGANGYVKQTSNGSVSLPQVASAPSTGLAAGDLWYDSASNQLEYYNGGSVQTLGTASAGLTSLSVGPNLTADGTAGGTLNGPGTIDLSATGISAGTYSKITVDSYGRATSGTQITAADLPSSIEAGSGTAANPSYTFTADTTTGAYLPGVGSYALSTGGVERMRITNTGGVGIGTTTPAGELDVESTTTLATSPSGSYDYGFFVDYDTEPVSTASSASYVGGGNINSSSSNQSILNLTGTFSQGLLNPGFTGTLQSLDGLRAQAYNNSATTVTGAYGLVGTSINNSTGAITSAHGVSAAVKNVSTGTITNAYSVTAEAPVNTGGGTITNFYGVYIQNATGATNNNYSIYSVGGANYFGGGIGIGSTSPRASLDLSKETDAVILPNGTTAQEPSTAVTGMIRYNTNSGTPPGWLEFYNGSAWTQLSQGGSGTYLPETGGTLSNALTISSGGETISAGGLSVTGGINANGGGETNVGSVTGSSALTVAAGGTNQALTLDSAGTAVVNVGTGNGTGLSVLDPGAAAADYVTVTGAATGGTPTIGAAGSDTNIPLTISPKGTGAVALPTASLVLGVTAASYTAPGYPQVYLQTSPVNTAMSGIVSSVYPNEPSGPTNSYFHIGGNFVVYPDIAAGVTESSAQTGVNVSILRNGTNSSGDNGTVNVMRGLIVTYGHSDNDGSSPQSGSIFGLYLAPKILTGSVTGNMYDLFINTTTTGGTISGKHYGIYQADSTVTNYLRGATGIGNASPDGLLDVSGTLTQAPSSSIGAFMSFGGSSLTDSSTAASGTASGAVFNSIGNETLNASNTSVTTSNAETLYINGPPIAGTNESVVRSSAIYIHGGTAAGAGVTSNAYGLYANAPTGATNNYAATFMGGNVGIGNTSPNGLLDVSASLTQAPSNLGAFVSFGNQYLTDNSTAASGTASAASFNSIATTTLNASNTGVTTSVAKTLYLAGAPIAGTNETLTKSAAIYINGGSTAGAGTTTSAYAIYANAPTGATNNYAATFVGGNVGIGTTAPADTLDVRGLAAVNGIVSNGTTFTIASGCTSSTLTGGATTGSFNATTATCNPVINLPTAPNGWWCSASDITTTTVTFKLSANSTTSCTLTGSGTTANDVVVFHAEAY